MSWFSKKRNIAITVGAAVLAVVVIGLIIYGVCTHSEPGLLRVCWQPNGSVVYADPDSTEVADPEEVEGPCAAPEDLVWARKQLPLDVGWESYRDGDERSLKAAITDINRQLGFKLYRVTPEGEESEVLISFEPIEPGDPAGWAGHAKSAGDNVLFCNIGISTSASTDRMVYLVSHHELLHCAGLAHDPDNPASAIYPFTNDDSMWDTMTAARITDFDRALLRRLYHD